MDSSLLSKKYKVRKLTKNDLEKIYDLSKDNKIFYEYHPPFVTKESIIDDMEALPPRKDYEDKFYIGYYNDDELVAVMDLILKYPNEDISFIGLFMMKIKYQGKGIGTSIINDLCESLRTLGFKSIRLGVDIGNPQSNHFWQKNDFKVIKEDEFIVMERIL